MYKNGILSEWLDGYYVEEFYVEKQEKITKTIPKLYNNKKSSLRI